eukprot:gene10302-5755_t
MKGIVVSVQAACFVLGRGLWVSLLFGCLGGKVDSGRGAAEGCTGGALGPCGVYVSGSGARQGCPCVSRSAIITTALGGDIVTYAKSMSCIPADPELRGRILQGCMPSPDDAAQKLKRIGSAWCGVAFVVGGMRMACIGYPPANAWANY